MLRFIISRILLIIPTLVAISLFGFAILVNAPGDPAECLIRDSGDGATGQGYGADAEQLRAWRSRRGLDLPLFYFSISSLCGQDILQCTAAPWKRYIPILRLHYPNQYHRWLFGDGNWLTGNGCIYSRGVIRGDFGISYVTGQPVSAQLGSRIFWSLLLTFISALLALAISVPLGVRSALRPGSFFDRTSGFTTLLLYSLPIFWVAVLMLMLFAGPSVFGTHGPLLPASGVMPVDGYPPGVGLTGKIRLTAPYLIMPVICYTYGAIAYLSRIMRAPLIEVMTTDYIRAAKARGLKENTIIWKHGVRNALLPMITVTADILPFALGGSVIVESIFSVPGMGNEIYHAVQNKDYPIILAVFVLTGVMTTAGYLISDILYAIADPRIRFRKG